MWGRPTHPCTVLSTILYSPSAAIQLFKAYLSSQCHSNKIPSDALYLIQNSLGEYSAVQCCVAQYIGVQ